MEVSNPALAPAEEEPVAPLDLGAARLILIATHPAVLVVYAINLVAMGAWAIGIYPALHPAFGTVGWYIAGLCVAPLPPALFAAIQTQRELL